MNMIQIQDEIISRCNRAKMTAHIQNARKWGRIILVAKGFTDKEARGIVEQAIDVYHLQTLTKE